MNNSDQEWFEEVAGAVQQGISLINGAEEFNLVFDHILGLLSNATSLLTLGASGLAAFVAVTAIEETAKAHIGLYRNAAEDLKRSKDPLFKHSKKHILAAAPTVAMGARLASAVGKGAVKKLVEEARSGTLVSLREECIYFSKRNGALQVPHDVVELSRARELLLFAIEIFDDALVGYTKHSLATQGEVDELFRNAAV